MPIFVRIASDEFFVGITDKQVKALAKRKETKCFITFSLILKIPLEKFKNYIFKDSTISSF
jgi:hypothetical protein